jgi:filamentous hemagglutinin family protein
MNKTYRLVWNELLNAWVAVAEIVKARGKRSSQALLVSVPLAVLPAPTFAQTAPPATTLPTGGQVVAGSASIAQSGATMNITQSTQRAAIDWQTFSVGSGAKVNFLQPSSSAVALNRVLSGNPSQIFGQINANGQVFLTNPGGVYFAPGASVNVGALVATTHSISNADFMAGNYKFTRNGATGSVVNEGNLTADLGGYIALLAPEVRNHGVVIAQAGTVAMAAGETVTLQMSSSNTLADIEVEAATMAALVENGHAVQAPGGLIILSAQAADRLQGGVVKNTGTLEASSLTERGGVIRLEGDHITLASGSQTNASGATGGGTVLVGGGWQGGGWLYQATTTTLEADATIDVSATKVGAGGTAVLWSDIANPDSVTRADGTILARGGAEGGDGGKVETSGHVLDTGPRLFVDTGAGAGKFGVWLLDPYNYTIASSGGNMTGAQLNTALASANVHIQTSASTGAGYAGTSTTGAGDILINDSVTIPSSRTLTLTAGGRVAGNGTGNITNNGTLIVEPGHADFDGIQFYGVISGSGGLVKNGSGYFALYGANTYTGATTVNAGGLFVNDNTALGGTGSGTTVNSGATLGISDTSSIGEPITLNGGTLRSSGGSGSSTVSGAITLTANSYIGATGNTLTVSGVISGAYALTKNSSGTLILSGNNTYSGATTVSTGILQLGAAGRIADSSAVTVDSGATLDLNNYSETVGSIAGAGNITLGSGTLTAGGDNTSTAFSGVISGTGTLTKAGSGTLTLSGSNTYSGTTTISAGTLAVTTNDALGTNAAGTTVASGATLDFQNLTYSTTEAITLNGGTIKTSTGTSSFAGAITLGAASTFDVSGTQLTLSGIVSGSHGITKNGSGILVLSGANTYSGTTTISAGELRVGSGGTTGRLGTGQISTSGTGSLVFDRSDSNTFTNNINNAGKLVMEGSGEVILSGSYVTSTSGKVQAKAGKLSVKTSGAVYASEYEVLAGADLTLVSTDNVNVFTASTLKGAGNLYFDLGSYYFQVANKSNPDLTGNVYVKSGFLLAGNYADSLGTATINVLDGGVFSLYNSNTVPNNVKIAGNGSPLAGAIYGANTGALMAGGTGNLTGTLTLTANARVGNSPTLKGGIIGSYDLDINNGALIINTDAGDVSFAGKITGAGGLTKQGSNTLTLSGANTYTGATTVSAGTLAVTTNNALGSTAAGTTVASGAALDIQNVDYSTTEAITLNGGTIKTSTGTSSFAGAITLGAASTFDVSGTQLTLSGIVSGSHGITKNGSGSLSLYANNSYTGTTTLNAGITYASHNSAFGDTSAGTTVNSGADLAIANGKSIDEPLTLAGGTLRGAGASGNTATSSGAITLAANSYLSNNDGMTLTVSGPISGSYGITKANAGTVVLSGANTYSGTTTISAGTLQVGAGGTAGTLGSGSVTNNAALSFNRSDAITVSSVISGTGTLIQAGSGTLTLSGANTYSGTTTISAGTLAVTANDALGTNAAGTTVASGAALDLQNVTYSTTEAITLNGGTLKTSTGTSSFAGAITLGAASSVDVSGTQLTHSGSFNAAGYQTTFSGSGTALFTNASNDFGTVILSSAGTASLRDANDLTLGTSSLSGNLTAQAAGHLTLSGNITKSSGSDATANLKAGGDIILESSQKIESTGNKLHTILWSDSDAAGGGMIRMKPGSSIASAGGKVVLAGGADDGSNGGTAGDGTPDGFAAGRDNYGDNANGIWFEQATITTAGGDFTARGKGAATQNANSSLGFQMATGIIACTGASCGGANALNLDSGTGKITLHGVSRQTTGVNAQGVQLIGGKLSSASTAADAISIVGDASATNNTGWAIGVDLRGTVQTTTGGGIAITGTGGTTTGGGSSQSHGIALFNTGNILSNSGAITLTGNRGSAVNSSADIYQPGFIGQKAGTDVTASSSAIAINADTLTLHANDRFASTGTLAIQPRTAGTTIGVAGGSGTLQLPASYFTSNIDSGFSSIAIGSSTAGAVDVAAMPTFTGHRSIQSGGDITVSGAISWTQDKTLTLKAGGNINVAHNITATGNGAGLELLYGGTNGTTTPAAGSAYILDLANARSITLSGSAPTLKIGNESYTVLNSVAAVQGMSAADTTRAAIGQNLSLSGTTYTTAFYTGNFAGVLDGLGHTADGLTIRNSTGGNLGFFGYLNGATVRNFGVTNVDILTNSSAGTNNFRLGGIAGLVGGYNVPVAVVTTLDGVWSSGTIAATATTTPGNTQDVFYAGGLVGSQNGGTMNITRSYSDTNVSSQGSKSGKLALGGLVGDIGLYGDGGPTTTTSATVKFDISKSYATGAILQGTYGGYYAAGGLIGVIYSSGNSLTDSFSYSNEVSSGSFGGLVGWNGVSGTYARLYTTQSSVGAGYGVYADSYHSGTLGTATGSGAQLPVNWSSATWQVAAKPYFHALPRPKEIVYIKPKDATPSGAYGTAVYGSLSSDIGYDIVNSSGTLITLGTGDYANLGITGTPTFSINDSTPYSASAYTAFYMNGLSLNGSAAPLFKLNPFGSLSYYITKKPLTMTGTTAADKTYDGNTTASVTMGTLSGFVGSETVTATASGSFDSANAGSRTVTAFYTLANGTNGGLASNYTLDNTTHSATINKANATVTANSGTTVYNGQVQSVSGFTASGLVNGETVAVLTGVSTSGGSGTNAGTYTHTPGGSATNYNLSFVNGTLTIDKVNATVTANSGTTVYNGQAQSVSGFTASGLVNGETVAVLTGVSTSGGSGTNAGTYTHTPSGSATNYNLNFVNGTLTIDKAPLTVTANNDAKFLTQADATGYAGVSYSGLVNGETGAALGGTLAISRSNAGTNTPGTYAGVLIPSGLTSGNYSISYANGSYTIVPADQLLVRVTDASTTYGDPVGNYSIASAQYYNGTSVVNLAGITANGSNNFTISDGVGGSATFTLAAANAATSGSGSLRAGSYSLATSGTVTENSANFSNIINVTGSHTVGKKALTANAASGVSKVYDGTTAMAGLTVSLSSVVSGDTVSVSGNGGAYHQANAGTGLGYTLTGLTLSGTDAGNYVLSGGGSLTGNNGTITRAPLIVTANAASKTYDGLAYSGGNGVSYSGFVNGETSAVLGGTLAYGGTSQGAINAGSYVITPSGLTSGNYTISYNDGTLTINPASPTPTQTPEPPPPPQPPLAPLPTPDTNPPPLNPPSPAGDSGAGGIAVSLVKPPSVQEVGVIAVSVAKEMPTAGSGFTFPLPEQMFAEVPSDVLVQVTLANGDPLPTWLHFVSETKSFVASTVPAGALPIRVIITVGGRSSIMVISERME